MQNVSRLVMAGAIVLVVLVVGIILATGHQIGSSAIGSRLHASIVAPDPDTIPTDTPSPLATTPSNPDDATQPQNDVPLPGANPSKIPKSDIPPPDVPPDQKGEPDDSAPTTDPGDGDIPPPDATLPPEPGYPTPVG